MIIQALCASLIVLLPFAYAQILLRVGFAGRNAPGQLVTAAVRSKAGLAVFPTAICSSANMEATALGGVFMRHTNGHTADSGVGVYTPAPLGNECL